MDESDAANLENRKEQLRQQCENPLARLANTSAHLDTLKRHVAETIDDGAEDLRGVIDRMKAAVDTQRESLMLARNLISDIKLVPEQEANEESADE